MEKQYYILAPDRTTPSRLLWWRPNACGYTSSIDEAGKYSQSEIDGNPDYYNGGEAFAVPVEDVEQNATRVVLNEGYGNSLIYLAKRKAEETWVRKVTERHGLGG